MLQGLRAHSRCGAHDLAMSTASRCIVVNFEISLGKMSGSVQVDVEKCPEGNFSALTNLALFSEWP